MNKSIRNLIEYLKPENIYNLKENQNGIIDGISF